MGWPNIISIFRIIAVPVFIITLVKSNFKLAIIIYILSAITDALDGYIARLRHQKTFLGSFLDPFADKLLVISGYITLAMMNKIPFWISIIVFFRDLLIVSGWLIIYSLSGDSRITPKTLGKITIIFQMGTIFFILVNLKGLPLQILIYSMICLTIVSGIDYIICGIKRIISKKKIVQWNQ